MRAACLNLLLVGTTVCGLASAEGRYASTLGATEIPVNAKARLEFSCQQSATGVCHNTLFAESGAITQKLAVAIGQKRYLYDVPETMMLCVTDAPLQDLADCKNRQQIGDLVTPIRQR